MMTMRQYQIYLIDERYARDYKGKEKLIYGLFYDYYHSIEEHSRILARQIIYITKQIPLYELKKQLIPLNQNIQYFNGVYYLRMKERNGKLKSTAQLKVRNRVLHISSEGGFDAETTLFECIRKCKSSFLAVDLENKRYGWLKPIKERKLI